MHNAYMTWRLQWDDEPNRTRANPLLHTCMHMHMYTHIYMHMHHITGDEKTRNRDDCFAGWKPTEPADNADNPQPDQVVSGYNPPSKSTDGWLVHRHRSQPAPMPVIAGIAGICVQSMSPAKSMKTNLSSTGFLKHSNEPMVIRSKQPRRLLFGNASMNPCSLSILAFAFNRPFP